MIKKVLSVFLAGFMTIGFLSATGCANTWKGIGEDVGNRKKDTARNRLEFIRFSTLSR